MSNWFSNIFGQTPEQVRLAQIEDERVSEAKRILLERAELSVTDESGRHLSERKWRKHYDFIARL
jgi:hypothetical protein